MPEVLVHGLVLGLCSESDLVLGDLARIFHASTHIAANLLEGLRPSLLVGG